MSENHSDSDDWVLKAAKEWAQKSSGKTLTELAAATLPQASRRDALLFEELTRLRAIEACARKVADTAMMSNNMNQMFVSGRAIDELRKALGEK